MNKTTVMLGVSAMALSLSGLVGMQAASFDWAGATGDCFDWAKSSASFDWAGASGDSFDWAAPKPASFDWAASDPVAIALNNA